VDVLVCEEGMFFQVEAVFATQVAIGACRFYQQVYRMFAD
jgi:hypothetical protein